MTLPEAVKRLRQHLGLKQAEFARRLAISLPSVWRYENEARDLSPAILSRLHSLAIEQGENDLAEVFARSGGVQQNFNPHPNFAELALPHIDGDLALVLMNLTRSVFDPTIDDNQRKATVSEAVLKLMQCREFIQVTQSHMAEAR